MKDKIHIKKRVESNFNFDSWCKNRELLFSSIGNRWQANLLYEEDLMIFSSEYPPVLRLIDKKDNPIEGKIRSFEFERLSCSEHFIKSNSSIGLKQLKDVGYHDIEITSKTKASFNFSGLIPIENISICVLELKETGNYSVSEFDSDQQKLINKQTRIETDIVIETGVLLELENGKSILVKYIEDFEMYFSIIGSKEEIDKRNYLYSHLTIAGKNKSIKVKEKTIYNIA